MQITKRLRIASTLLAWFVFSFNSAIALAAPTYSDTRTLPSQRRSEAARDQGQHIYQDSVSTANAILSAPVESISAEEKAENYIVREVRVEGNHIVPAGPILKKVMTRSGMPFNENTAQIDAQAISAMGWFSDIRIRLKEVDPEEVKTAETAAPDADTQQRQADAANAMGPQQSNAAAVQRTDAQPVDVIFEVEENPVFSRLEASGNTKIGSAVIQKELGLQPGEIANTAIINYQLEKLMDDYHRAGYTAARILDVAMTESGVLHIVIDEGVIESITVKGNKKTKDYVILREMRFKPGDPFNVNEARRSIQRLNNLGYLLSSDMRLKPGKDPRKLNVEVEVLEDASLTVGAGVGYSESERLFGTVTVKDINLNGTGDAASLQWEVGSKSKSNYYLSYTHPWLDKKETTLTVAAYGHTHEYTEYDRHAYEIGRYDKKSNGQEITLSRADGEYSRNYLKLKRRNDKYVDPIHGYSPQYYEESYNERYYQDFGTYTTASQRRKQNFGETRSITFSRITDKRDNVFFPRTGNMTTFSIEQAGFGGDFNFTKLGAEHRFYIPQGPNVFAVDLMAGHAWGDLPLSQRFALGGASLRGYEEDQFMGNSLLKGTLEYRVPISKKVTVLAFADAGYAWDKRDEKRFDLSKTKVGYGAGLRFNTPLGPVKLDYGFGQDRSRFHFSFGNQF